MRCPRVITIDCPATCWFYKYCRQALSNTPHFTPRERQVIECVGRGLPNKLIANELGISEATAKVHVKTVIIKTRCVNRVQLALWWASKRQVEHVCAP